MNEIFEDKIDASTIFATFIIGSIVADGKIDEEKYTFLYPMLYTFFGDTVDYESRVMNKKRKLIIKSLITNLK